jgi:CubicO group peptidase (beta-lactamase class C family)
MIYTRFAAASMLFLFSVINSVYTQTYNGTQAGKVLRTWFVSGPLMITKATGNVPDYGAQEAFFNRTGDQNMAASLSSNSSRPKKWMKFHATSDIIDFDSIFNHADYASAYAYAVIESKVAKPALFAIGSDDGLKVWHNGKLIHKNWLPRAIVPDDDIIKIPLVKGKNEILIEVQDIAGGWGFTARFLDREGLTKRLVKSASVGDLDVTKQMLEGGADVNARGENGLTPLDAARIGGRDEVAQVLLAKGAASTEVPSAEKIIRGFYSSLDSKPNPGISILVAKDGKIIYSQGFGLANIEQKTPVTSQTKFRIGSITKQFVASAILKLQEDGKLSVEDKLSKYFNGYPRGDEVTIHHLLTHTSGIHSFTNKDSFLTDVVKPVTNDQLLAYFINDKYDFNPGERYQYNNSGYFLLGYIIEKITGDKYGNYLKKQFFEPLGMTNTGVHTPGLRLEMEAVGYEKSGSDFKKALNWNMDWAGGAGSLYSTVEDLNKWNEALFNGKVLKEQSMKSAFTPVVLKNGSPPPGIQYGYGWGINNYRGVLAYGHSGGLNGFISQFLRIPGEDMSVVMLTNVSPPQAEIDPMKIAELYLWEKMLKQSSFEQQKEPEKDIEKYTGRYDFGQGMILLVTREEAGLFAQMSGQPKNQIYPSSPGNYFWKVVEAKIRFITDTEGKVTQAEFEQGSFKITAPKMKDLQIVRVDSTILRKYTGVYKYKEGTMVTISAGNGKIYGQATGEPRFELQPLSDTEFIIPEINATLTFKTDATGKADSVRIRVAGQDIDSPRVE